MENIPFKRVAISKIYLKKKKELGNIYMIFMEANIKKFINRLR